MCVVCGCSGSLPAAAGASPQAAVVDARTGDLHFGAGAARVSVPGMSESRAIRIEQDVLGANNQVAQHNRAHFHAHGVRALNLVSSPGSGKTTLLCATIRATASPRAGMRPSSQYRPPAQSASPWIAWRPTSWKAMFWAECLAPVASGSAEKTRFG